MQRFAALMDALTHMPSPAGKQRLIADYLHHAPDPDRGYGLAILTGDLALPSVKTTTIRDMVAARLDPVLFGWSHEYVGDLVETVALIWPAPPGLNRPPPTLAEIADLSAATSPTERLALLADWFDVLDATSRWVLLKLLTGGLRVGVTARMARTALVDGVRGWDVDVSVDAVEERWHGLSPPYAPLFDWLSGRAAAPAINGPDGFRPLMRANPADEAAIGHLNPDDFRAEWKWDGLRVQIVANGTPAEARLYDQDGEEMAGRFPDIRDGLRFTAVLDGELLIRRDGRIAPAQDLLARMNRKRVTPALLRDHPAWVRLHDILVDGTDDLRALPFDERRRRLEAWFDRVRPAGMDLSPLIDFSDWAHLTQRLRPATDGPEKRPDGGQAIAGLMLKRRDSAYVGGRADGLWFKWKRGPLTADWVLMYAQRGIGARASFYSSCTFGAWRGEPGADGTLVPVGKAEFNGSDAELVAIDRWVRDHTTDRFGPVREVAPGLVLEVAFDNVHRSSRHKSGIALRAPRIMRLRWDKPAADADRLEVLERMVVE